MNHIKHTSNDRNPAPASPRNGCTECGLCVKECAFLEKYGTPAAIARACEKEPLKYQGIAFECSLCGLCATLCPVEMDPAAMFLNLRRDAVQAGHGDFPEHGTILAYEKRGTSKKYTWYHLPPQCDTIFFPGCALSGTRPERTRDVYGFLKERIASLGIVLDCCTKPSHDLGREEHFHLMFSEMKNYLTKMGIKKVIVACPNCYNVFSQYGENLKALTVYEVMAEYGLPEKAERVERVTIHDPCVVRSHPQLHDAVRKLVQNQGLELFEMDHSRQKTLCCGEGGSAGFISKQLANTWGHSRKKESRENRIITYCAGCAGFLDRVTPTSHILDLIWEPEKALSGKERVARPPFTYLNRLRLKKELMKERAGTVTRERTLNNDSAPPIKMMKMALLLVIMAAIFGLKAGGFLSRLTPDHIRSVIEGYGPLAPVLYILIYTLAPSLFLPALPLTIAGGILFGPVRGVIYTITGATGGACVAFLFARYIAGEWVESRLNGPRWLKLNRRVEKHGWKVVAVTRLIPLFPFNLLNYAFGLTKIKFIHYAAATFVCMLPACIAFIVFSSSLPDLLAGHVSPGLIAGVVLIVLVSAIPIFYNRFKKN